MDRGVHFQRVKMDRGVHFQRRKMDRGGGPFYTGGVHFQRVKMDRGVHFQRVKMDRGSIFNGGPFSISHRGVNRDFTVIARLRNAKWEILPSPHVRF